MDSTTSGISRFSDWLKGFEPYPRRLAWCHTTDSFRFKGIAEQGRFEPRACPIFAEALIYFFYGRPAFRFTGEQSLRISSRAPVVMILDPDLYLRGKRMYPFDSGAFWHKRYATWMHEAMTLSDFALECPSDAPQRHVTSFFENNGNYLRLRARRPTLDYAADFEVDSLVELLLDRDNSHADDRRIAVELQVATAVPFSYPHVRAVLLPEELKQSPWVRALMSGTAAGIEFRGYDMSPCKPAKEYQGLLEQMTCELQESSWSMG